MNVFIEYFVVPIVTITGGYIIYRRLTVKGKRLRTSEIARYKSKQATVNRIVKEVNDEPSSPGTTIEGRLPR